LFLDTRNKIVPLRELQESIQERPAKWHSGHFDPLLAEHVRRLQQARQPGWLLIVEVTDPTQPLLSQRARAELVAALSIVDYVVLGEAGPSADEDITGGFIELVLHRHSRELRP
jgi:bifunctional ADP-heptose synthase (sugar kinase/adenylyltransferase)